MTDNRSPETKRAVKCRLCRDEGVVNALLPGQPPVPCPRCVADGSERSQAPFTSKERTRRGHIMVLREILHHGTVETGAWEAAIRYAIHKLELQSPDETTASPQAPIVKVIIENGKAAYTTIYAPGLPDGTHDLYCEPEAVAPMMRAEAQTSGECPVCLGERRVTIGRRAIGQDSRVKALQMMYVEQPCPMCNAQKAGERP